MATLDYIKSYLVKLGVDIDQNELAKWDSGLKKLDKGFKSTVSGLVSSYSKVAGIYSTLSLGIAKFATSVAQSDMEMQKFANRMYMSRDSAKALQTTLDAMGLNGVGDLQDVALNPELTKQYRELISLSTSLNTPAAVKQSLKDIRAISFEFDKLNTIFDYFQERVVHFIYQTVKGPAQKFQEFLKNFNNTFSKNINKWAENLGRYLGIIVRLTFRFIEGLSTILSKVGDIWNRLSSLSKGFIATIFLINKIIRGSPIWKLITVFTSFLMLLDDYKTYKEGGISATILKPVWKTIDEQRENPESGWNFLVNSIKNLVDGINRLIEVIKETVSKIEGSKLGKLLGLGEEPKQGFAGDNVQERVKNQLEYIEQIPFWKRLLADLTLGKFGTNQEEFLINRLNNPDLTNITQTKYIPINQEDKNFTPINETKNNSVNQTFNFNLTGVNDPNKFINDVSSLIRNNGSRLVG